MLLLVLALIVTGPTSVSWTDAAGEIAWTRNLPRSLQRTSSVLELADAVLIYNAEAMLAVRIRDGKTLLAWIDQRPRSDRHGFNRAMIDRGTITVTLAKKSCTAEVSGQTFAVACGDVVIYFGAGVLALIRTKPWKLVAKIELRGPDIGELEGECPGTLHADVDQTARVGPARARFTGVRETVCRT
jgi:hypothetical protein